VALSAEGKRDNKLHKIVGHPLGNEENRSTGQHTHSYEQAQSAQFEFLKQQERDKPDVSTTLHYTTMQTGGVVGGVQGTNAPYVQLLQCIKS
jgi:hypothetical protein